MTPAAEIRLKCEYLSGLASSSAQAMKTVKSAIVISHSHQRLSIDASLIRIRSSKLHDSLLKATSNTYPFRTNDHPYAMIPVPFDEPIGLLCPTCPFADNSRYLCTKQWVPALCMPSKLALIHSTEVNSQAWRLI